MPPTETTEPEVDPKNEVESDGRKSYDENYVKSLRDESRKRLERSQAAERERDELRAKQEARDKKELEEQQKFRELLDKEREERNREKAELSEKLTAADRRLILAEAKTLAIKAGIIDADDVKAALDVADLRIDDDGSVPGLKEKIAELKEAKPHWFKESKSKDDDGKKRSVSTPDRKQAADYKGPDYQKMSDAEFREALKGFGVTS